MDIQLTEEQELLRNSVQKLLKDRYDFDTRRKIVASEDGWSRTIWKQFAELGLLGFEVEAGRFGCWRPPCDTEAWLNRFAWMDRLGDRWWPVLGSVYFLVAVKRVRGMRLIGLVRDKPRSVKHAAPAAVANRRREQAEMEV